MAMMGLRAQHTQNQIVALSLSGVVCLRVNLTNGRNASLFGLVTDKLGQVDLSVTVGNAHGGVWNETHPSRRTFYLPVLKTKEAGRLFAAFLLMADTLPSEDQARDLQRAIDNLAIDKNRSFGLNR